LYFSSSYYQEYLRKRGACDKAIEGFKEMFKIFENKTHRNVCMLRMRTTQDGNYWIRCTGSLAEKKKCPEWGSTIAAEEYYKNKLKKGE